MLSVLFGAFLVPTWSGDTPQYKDLKPAGALATVCRLAGEERRLRTNPWGFSGGTVVDVTEDTLTVRTQSGFRRTFEVGPAPASARIPVGAESLWHAHRLSQVRVGDVVSLCVAHPARGDVIVALGIRRRPGGVIPPAEDEHLPKDIRSHNVANRGQMRDLAEEVVAPKLARVLARTHR